MQDLVRYGLLGKSLKHSFSASFFTQKFEASGIPAVYENIELQNEGELRDWLKKNSSLYKGVNVTIPYKEKILPFLDEIDEEARAIGAVNTVRFEGDKAKGYNTDAYGFRQAIKPFFKSTHEKALILGTGGASKAIAHVFKNLGIDVNYLSTSKKGDQIFAYEEVNENMIAFHKVIVNCTPLGTSPNLEEMPNLPIHLVDEGHLVIDLIYNPSETRFLREAKQSGAVTLNGLSMLQHQALKAWEIWNA